MAKKKSRAHVISGSNQSFLYYHPNVVNANCELEEKNDKLSIVYHDVEDAISSIPTAYTKDSDNIRTELEVSCENKRLHIVRLYQTKEFLGFLCENSGQSDFGLAFDYFFVKNNVDRSGRKRILKNLFRSIYPDLDDEKITDILEFYYAEDLEHNVALLPSAKSVR